MIGYKSDHLRQEFHDVRLNPRLRVIVHALDSFLHWKHGVTLIIITSIYREGDPGVHGYWRGIDVRSRNWKPEVKKDVEEFLNNTFQYDPTRKDKPTCIIHDVGRGEHGHLQVTASRRSWR